MLRLGDAGFHERQGRGIHAWPLVAHAPAVVNHQAHADRDVFALEDGQFCSPCPPAPGNSPLSGRRRSVHDRRAPWYATPPGLRPREFSDPANRYWDFARAAMAANWEQELRSGRQAPSAIAQRTRMDNNRRERRWEADLVTRA